MKARINQISQTFETFGDNEIVHLAISFNCPSGHIACNSRSREYVLPKVLCATLVLLALLFPLPSLSQTDPAAAAPSQNQSATPRVPVTPAPAEAASEQNTQQTAPQKGLPEAPQSTIIDENEKVLKQSPRIAGVLPNFTAVDSNTRLPRLSTREKFVVATHDSLDYSSFLLAGALAAKGLHSNATPQLGSGAAGFGRYYWREFTDQAVGTFFTEAIFPTFTHEDPRYYTLGRNGFWRRSYYAISRTVITKNDAGGEEFNISEIGGNATEAGLSNLYYPSEERGFGKTAKNFGTQTVITAGANVLKEFWPDIRKNVLRMKDADKP